MTIAILPARLANQIAAGEVVERPASVIKELVENSLDAGADKIHIDIEKGGAKLIRITDNGGGIVKDELMLALSRHATSKIKDLNDLEAISSLGFRGEALASISSVARLTLTSKPAKQSNAWQAYAQGRDMEVTIQPAAHPNGTTIEVSDLFFNTPARRKFLRTEKTEFNHIDEIVKRIALARFDVSITLTHNGKTIRQYRHAKDKSQYAKRVAMICSQAFVEHAIEIDCPHDNMHLWGWIAKPSFYRSHNDLCYSYVNGRMMRDKLINHGIRQAFSDLLPNDTYPAFVLFLEVDHKDVDVNVHPAKHEVRFHQGRYVHDFIYSVCHKALQSSLAPDIVDMAQLNDGSSQDISNAVANAMTPGATGTAVQYERDYVQPLRQVSEVQQAGSHSGFSYQADYKAQRPSHQATQAYQRLMTPSAEAPVIPEQKSGAIEIKSSSEDDSTISVQLLKTIDQHYAVVWFNEELRLLNVKQLSLHINKKIIERRWQEGFVSQPLLLPVVVSVEEDSYQMFASVFAQFEHAGIIAKQLGKGKIQIRQYPAILREQDVAQSFQSILQELARAQTSDESLDKQLKSLLAKTMTGNSFDGNHVQQVLNQLKATNSDDFIVQLRLNSVEVDLTSSISKLH